MLGKPKQLLQFRHGQTSCFELLLSGQRRHGLRHWCRVRRVALLHPRQVGGVVGVGGVGWDEGVVGEAEDGVALGELVHGVSYGLGHGYSSAERRTSWDKP